MKWTDEAKAELRRLMNYELTYDEIGERLGCTANAARVKAYKLGWTGFVRGRRAKGTKRSPETIAKMAARTKEQWADPAFREKMVAAISEAAKCPKRRAKISKAYAKIRGFDIPADKRADYDFLLRCKGLTKNEAAAVLGILPSNQNRRKRVAA